MYEHISLASASDCFKFHSKKPNLGRATADNLTASVRRQSRPVALEMTQPFIIKK